MYKHTKLYSSESVHHTIHMQLYNPSYISGHCACIHFPQIGLVQFTQTVSSLPVGDRSSWYNPKQIPHSHLIPSSLSLSCKLFESEDGLTGGVNTVDCLAVLDVLFDALS